MELPVVRTDHAAFDDCEVFEKPGIHPQSDVIVCVLPGNPGIITFYVRFITLLAKHVHCKKVIGVSHRGHKGKAKQSNYGLEDQVSHKEELLKALLELEGERSRFVLVTHSVGSWIALRVLQRNKYLANHVVKLFQMCPTIRNLAEGMSGLIHVVFQPGVRHVLASLLHCLPVALKRLILYVASQDSDEAKYVGVEISDYALAMNIVVMARDEAHHIREVDAQMEATIRSWASRMVVYYSVQDRYVPMTYVDEFRKRFPDVECHIAPEHVEHAFVLRQSDEVATFIIERLALEGLASV